MLYVKTLQNDKLHNQPLQTEIRSLNDSQLGSIIEFGWITLNMAGNEEGSDIFDNLENLEASLSDEIKMVLVYIAGYITRNDNQPSEYETYFYYKKYGRYTNSINCE